MSLLRLEDTVAFGVADIESVDFGVLSDLAFSTVGESDFGLDGFDVFDELLLFEELEEESTARVCP
jgi:hypothetical protein